MTEEVALIMCATEWLCDDSHHVSLSRVALRLDNTLSESEYYLKNF